MNWGDKIKHLDPANLPPFRAILLFKRRECGNSLGSVQVFGGFWPTTVTPDLKKSVTKRRASSKSQKAQPAYPTITYDVSN